MSLLSFPPDELLELINAENYIVFNTVAASAFFFWEYCITFGQEVELIWRWKWGIVNFIFVAIRYLSFGIRIVELLFYANLTGLIRPSEATCRDWVRLELISGHIIALCVDILLAMRTFAFYGRDRRMLFPLFFIVLAGQAASITIMVLVLPGFVSIPSPVPSGLHFGACVVLKADNRFPDYIIPTLVVESCLTLLVAVKFVYGRLTIGAYTPHMLVVFIRDGAWAFALVFAILVWTLATYQIDPLKGDIAITWLFSILSFCGTRLILNLRSESPTYKNMFNEAGSAVELYPISPVSRRSEVPFISPVESVAMNKFREYVDSAHSE